MSGTAGAEYLPATTEDAAAQISGSQWPGVINHLLQRPLPGTTADGQEADIHIDYPSFGIPAIDADVRAWVSGIANAFAAHLDLSRAGIPGASLTPVHDPMEADDAPDQRPTFELWGSYSISRPSDAAVSITFEIWNYAGTPQGNLDILTLNYSLITGQRLAFMDLFEKPETALALMSAWSRRELAPRLGASVRLRMLDDGTAPLVENFSSLTLTPQGICINFQPYQVAPWAAGVQKVEMPLEALLPAGPLLALWGR
ncbi:RsiV family protein [Desulfovibrio sp.]|uniref:RsiV family protein n=1 Tax=Desulfovibrio sp. TaxID=885 RepID=UPI0023BEA471|nr:RsiV family protein [Desulfovibrio sp.]MDE7240943.1 RsiV family protein [Desulfovibrio sp.]